MARLADLGYRLPFHRRDVGEGMENACAWCAHADPGQTLLEGSGMKAEETTLRKLIGGEQQFVVPLYQRTYSWGFRHLDTLWNDVVDQERALADGRPKSHFLGSVVLAPGPALSPSLSQWVVVDGQQRLTTLMIALCAIRDHQAAEDPLHIERINELHLINKFKRGNMRYRLLPTQVDRSAMIACIEGDHDGQTSGAIGDAYRFFRARLIDIDAPADPHDVSRIEEVVLDHLALVQIVVEKGDNAFRIFESLNNTGLPLSPVDLIRNYVFMCLPTRGEEVYRKYWYPFQERLRSEHGTKALETLMYQVLVLDRGEEATYADAYLGHQEILREASSDEAEVEAYVAELARRARHLEVILSPTKEAHEPTRDHLAFLNEWRATTAYPAIMRLLELREDGVPSDEVAQALSYIESFFVRRMIAGVTTKNLNRIFQRLTGRLTDDTVAETVRIELSPERLYWPTDDELRDAIRTNAFYWRGQAIQRKLVLRRLADTFDRGEPVLLTSKKITIEHVMPQHLTDAWRAELAADGEDPARTHRELVHTLGNLTLTAYNSELGDMAYRDKRDRLSQTGIAMTHAIVQQPRWRRTEILARADDLASRALAIWPGPDEQSRGTSPRRDWTLLHDAMAAIPSGTWTTYTELAQVAGSAPMPVAVHVSTTPLPNAHRVLTNDGTPPEEITRPDEANTRTAREVLTEEGIDFDEQGHADLNKRVNAVELADLLDLPDVAEFSTSELQDVDPASLTEHQHRFHRQLAERGGPDISRAVSDVIGWWTKLAGTFWYGTSATGRCTPYLKHDGTDYWMLNIYPEVTEVPFRSLKRRTPFDDPQMRGELRRRLNQAPQIEIPEAKLDLFPSFPNSLLTDPAVLDVVISTLHWFIDRVQRQELA
jgi:alkylated DNA nucleotide flippase Atl1